MTAIRFAFIAMLASVAAVLPAAAAKVSATLSTTSASVGEPVQYELTVEGRFDPAAAPVPQVDGLEVVGTAHGSQLSIIGGNVTRRNTITYRLIPRREGSFSIPPLEVVVEGQSLKTRGFTLTVTPGKTVKQEGDFAFAEIRLGKSSAYVGEAVPLEVRLYLDPGPRWNLQQLPMLSGSGFTTQPFGRPSQRTIPLAGKEYILATFRTLITPGKAGKLTIGPFPARMVFSQRTRSRLYRLPFDEAFGPPQELDVNAPAVELDVRALPTEGRPDSFSGAIGKFQFNVVGTPNRVNVGEPVQMTVTITGEGNFDRIAAPPIPDDQGWRIYDAEQRFEPSDEIGYSGTKTFSIPVAPTAAKNAMPVFAFSYFDPETERYHTLTSSTLPLTVTGAPAAVAAAPAEAGGSGSASSGPAPASGAVEPQDILGILPNPGPAWSAGPAFSTPFLVGLLIAPAPVLAGVVLWRLRRGDPAAMRRSRFRTEKAAYFRRVRGASTRGELLDAAVRLLQVEAAFNSNKEPHAFETADILAAREVDPETARAIEELMADRAALVYAGGVRDGDTLSASVRDRVLAAIEGYERSPSR